MATCSPWFIDRGDTAPLALDSSGRAGSGSDAAAMRAEGLTEMPLRDDVRSATVPGVIDGWVALHERCGALPLARVLEPAIEYAADGFPASPLLSAAIVRIAHLPGADDYSSVGDARPGVMIRRPTVARLLADIGDGGRDAAFAGDYGRDLLDVGAGLYSDDDLRTVQARWVEPLSVDAFGHRIWTVPPSSQGYLALAGAWVADRLDLPTDPDDPQWAHLMVETAKHVGADRPAALFDGADGVALLEPERLAAHVAAIDPSRAADLVTPAAPGGTIYLCAVDASGDAVSLIQSNAAGWGCHVVLPRTRVFLHDRGVGFSLAAGHPAELRPGARPPHTLAPTLVTDLDGAFRACVGTMGGDHQPQVVLQLLARLFHAGQDPATAVAAARPIISRTPSTGFDTWSGSGDIGIAVEAQAPPAWATGLTERGHMVTTAPAWATSHGHAHVIARDGDVLAGAADPRALSGRGERMVNHEPGTVVTEIRRVRSSDGRLVDLRLANGRVAAVTDAATNAPAAGGAGVVDAGGALVIGAFAEPHAHLDKALTADLVPNPAGDLMGAIEAWRAHSADRTVAEIADRARRATLAAVAHGTTAIRSHVDVNTGIGLRAMEALVGVKAELADIVDLQLVALMGRPLAGPDGADHRALLDAAMELGADVVGGCPHLESNGAGLIDHALETADRFGADVDLHVDETLDPSMRTLDLLARAVIDSGFARSVTASHCVSLGMRSEAEQRSCADLVAEAGVAVVTLPQTNLFLQARGVSSAPPRGLTAIGALTAAGVTVAGGGDNVEDPFNIVGRNDPLETAALLVMAGHLTATDALAAVSERSRTIMGLPHADLTVGAAADLVILPVQTERQAIAEAPPSRTVIKGGRMVAESVYERRLYRSTTEPRN